MSRNQIRLCKSQDPSELRVPLTQDQMSNLNSSSTGNSINLSLQIPDKFNDDETYFFFTHFQKKPNQKDLIESLLKKNIRVIDYEEIKKAGKRQVAMGKISGQSAAITLLSGLGIYFLKKGVSTPYLHVKQCFRYSSCLEAQQALKSLEKIDFKLVIGLTGDGQTSQGFQEILNALDAKYIEADDLPSIWENNDFGIFVTKLNASHMVSSNQTFDKQDYYQNPQKYKAIFHEKYAPYINILVNCNYYDSRYPKLLTKSQIRVKFQISNSKNKTNFAYLPFATLIAIVTITQNLLMKELIYISLLKQSNLIRPTIFKRTQPKLEFRQAKTTFFIYQMKILLLSWRRMLVIILVPSCCPTLSKKCIQANDGCRFEKESK